VQAAVRAIEYFLPPGVVSTETLAAQFPSWSVAKIDEKTGIRERHIAAPDQCSSDLAVAAAMKLFESGASRPDEIDFILLCTQSPDYFLPTTACLVQERLGIPTSAGALDFNLGCSGFVYGLGLCQGLVATGQARHILLLTAETYSKFIHPNDRGVRTIFGDAAAATLVTGKEADEPLLGPFVYGTDGSGGDHLMVRAGGMRQPCGGSIAEPDRPGAANLYMNGPEVFTFTLEVVPSCVNRLLRKADLSIDDIDLFVFHQANRYMLEHLRQRMNIPPERFFIAMEHCGNTVSSTVPIALKEAEAAGRLQPGSRVLLAGFGVGYSWAATILRWTGTGR
jgi:3-oxoacyl-[acyl-carrier-protein] synthase III